jgi:hypothetical protein
VTSVTVSACLFCQQLLQGFAIQVVERFPCLAQVVEPSSALPIRSDTEWQQEDQHSRDRFQQECVREELLYETLSVELRLNAQKNSNLMLQLLVFRLRCQSTSEELVLKWAFVAAP